MGAGSAVLSKSLRGLDQDQEIDFPAFRKFLGTHYKPEHETLFLELAAKKAAEDRENGVPLKRGAVKAISFDQLKNTLEDTFVAVKIWRQIKKTWDGGPDWSLVEKLIKSRPSAVQVLDVETKTMEVEPQQDPRTLEGKEAEDSRPTPDHPVLNGSTNTATLKNQKKKFVETREVVVQRTLLDVAVEHAVTREYRLDLNVLTLMHESWPELIRQRNADGDNPLHVAVATWPRSPTDVAVSLVELCPQAARDRDGRGRLPLAAALEKGTADELVLALVRSRLDSDVSASASALCDPLC